MPNTSFLRQSIRSFFILLSVLALYLTNLGLTPVLAQTRYIKPSSEVAVRRGQGTEFRIVAIVKDGSAVEQIEESDDYALIRTQEGTQGWILKRYLSEDLPLEQMVEDIEEEREIAKQRELEANRSIVALSSDLERLTTELQALTSEKEEIEVRYNEMEQAAADISKIKEDYQNLSLERKLLKQSLAEIEQKYEVLQKNSAMYWFLAGGGVLLVGIIIGRTTAMSRKRKQSLLQ